MTDQQYNRPTIIQLYNLTIVQLYDIWGSGNEIGFNSQIPQSPQTNPTDPNKSHKQIDQQMTDQQYNRPTIIQLDKCTIVHLDNI